MLVHQKPYGMRNHFSCSFHIDFPSSKSLSLILETTSLKISVGKVKKKKQKFLFLNSNRVKTDKRKSKISFELSKKTDIKLNHKYFTLIFYLSETFFPLDYDSPRFLRIISNSSSDFTEHEQCRQPTHTFRGIPLLWLRYRWGPQNVIRLTRWKRNRARAS